MIESIENLEDMKVGRQTQKESLDVLRGCAA